MTAVAHAVAAPVAHPTLTVDLGVVAANTRLIAARTQGEVMAVVKADGFGLGAADVAHTALAAGATRLGVATLDEALALRAAGLEAPVLTWMHSTDTDWRAARNHGVDVAVSTREQLDAIACEAPGSNVHLHLDTGMARDGAAPEDWHDLCRAARGAERRGTVDVVGVMGHLACANLPERDSPGGVTRFAWGLTVARAYGLRPRDRHLATTAPTLTDPASHHTMSRIGAGLVGIDPSHTTDLRGPVTLTAPLAMVRQVRAGTGVGYDHTWVADGTTRLGTIPLGYADGLPRVASGLAEVLVEGVRRALVGRISMDCAVVDLGDLSVAAGTQVTVLGPGGAGEPTLHDWATWAATNEHEVLTGLGARGARTTRVVRRAPLRSRS